VRGGSGARSPPLAARPDILGVLTTLYACCFVLFCDIVLRTLSFEISLFEWMIIGYSFVISWMYDCRVSFCDVDLRSFVLFGEILL